MNRRTLQLPFATGLAGLPFAATTNLLGGSPDFLPRWVPIAGRIIAGAMGGAVGFVISKHRQSMEQQKKQRLQHSRASRRFTVNQSAATLNSRPGRLATKGKWEGTMQLAKPAPPTSYAEL
jgi:hypothetical protein